MTTFQETPVGKNVYVFYDFETTGTSPAFDQPLQFAAILTDAELEPVGEINIRCRLSPHILPAPWALAVTGVTPAQLTDPDCHSQFEFMSVISGLIDEWGPATWVGYNTIAFDEAVMRQAFYQNLHPSIYRTQINGNQRMDIMKTVYAVWELANDTLNWPFNDKEQVSFKLEHLAPANGFDEHDAHDALGDVRATIHLASLIRERAPEVWKQSLRNRSKQDVNALLESGAPLRLVERFGAQPPRSYVGAFAGRNPDNPSTVGFLDLAMVDPEALAEANDDALADAVAGTPKLVRSVKVNGFPSLFEYPEVITEIKQSAEALSGMTELHERVGKALAGRYDDKSEPEHVEEQIYGGFPGDADRHRLQKFQTGSWEDRVSLLSKLDDRRYYQLGRRLIYEHRPDLLSDDVRDSMLAGIRERWQAEKAPWTTFTDVDAQLEEIQEVGALDEEQLGALLEFYDGMRGNEA